MAYTDVIKKVRQKNPLIHCITNNVVINFTANGLIALGASPVMASDKEEAAQMVQHAQALLINIGTLAAADVEAMIHAGKEANRLGIPVIFDPVGVGATAYRTETAHRILSEVGVAVIRGNAGEIAVLGGTSTKIKGVDGSGEGISPSLVQQIAREQDAIIIATGKIDILSDGKDIYSIANGHDMLTTITGSGCLLGAVIAAFAGSAEDMVEACIGALAFYGIAAEKAAENAKAPGSFQVAFLDQLYLSESATDGEKVDKMNVEVK
ncbi:hydroxyethylthiazole kinase [Terribacillus saccharophilus]|uniref:hydroxyethylthiazole kinase n=1 Tax=Terribacillus saccharophilus TaxID=361277 RepID=UPI0039819DDC